MRSESVVFPESIWAEIPMFLRLDNSLISNLMAKRVTHRSLFRTLQMRINASLILRGGSLDRVRCAKREPSMVIQRIGPRKISFAGKIGGRPVSTGRV